LACEPALLIADEPTSSLDAGAAADFLRLLGQLKQRRGTALLLISHDSVVLAKVSDRIMIMYAGRVVEQGLTGEVLETPIHPYTCALLGCELQSQPVELQRPGKNRMLTITGRPPDPSHERFGCDFFNRCPDKLDLCRARVPEEIHVSNFHSTRCFKVGG
jgi:oligopeptide/dipeptide ABC transporter ATP-binding protein